jgi:hypothetical protein
MFYEPYPPRYVNNLYLDSAGLENYHDNVTGMRERRKVRIRWYGDLFGKIEEPTLEFKVKDGLVGTKVGYPFAPFILGEGFCHRYYRDVLREAGLSAEVEHGLRGLHVVLCNRYRRWYYATRDGRFRLTVDVEMTFLHVKRTCNHFVHKRVDHSNIIVELKYDKPWDVQAERVARALPFSMTKYSKYVTGIEQVYH